MVAHVLLTGVHQGLVIPALQLADGQRLGDKTPTALAREHRSFAILPDDGPPLIVIRVDPADDVEWALDLIVEDNMPMLAFVDGTDGLRMRSKFYRVY